MTVVISLDDAGYRSVENGGEAGDASLIPTAEMDLYPVYNAIPQEQGASYLVSKHYIPFSTSDHGIRASLGTGSQGPA